MRLSKRPHITSSLLLHAAAAAAAADADDDAATRSFAARNLSIIDTDNIMSCFCQKKQFRLRCDRAFMLLCLYVFYVYISADGSN